MSNRGACAAIAALLALGAVADPVGAQEPVPEVEVVDLIDYPEGESHSVLATCGVEVDTISVTYRPTNGDHLARNVQLYLDGRLVVNRTESDWTETVSIAGAESGHIRYLGTVEYHLDLTRCVAVAGPVIDGEPGPPRGDQPPTAVSPPSDPEVPPTVESTPPVSILIPPVHISRSPAEPTPPFEVLGPVVPVPPVKPPGVAVPPAQTLPATGPSSALTLTMIGAACLVAGRSALTLATRTRRPDSSPAS